MLNKNHRINILGCLIDNLSFAETVNLIEEMIRSKKPHQHVSINTDKLLKFHHDNGFKEIINSCDIINADGMSIIWASRILGRPIKERVPGIDLMEHLIWLASKKRYSIYFLGAREGVVTKVVEIYKNIYPDLRVVGFRNGYWESVEEPEIVDLIRTTKADILFLAMSSPRKEIFLNKYLKTLYVPFVMGVGGSFDVVAGLKKRAPKWMQFAGIEWFFRLMQEPKRLWKRYLIGNLLFISLIMKELLKRFAFFVRNK